MTTAIVGAGNDWLRDHEVAGVPASGMSEPEKAKGRAVLALIDAALASLGVNGAITVKKATKSLLDADLAHAADTLAVVYNDATSANNGIYAKSGTSGSGSWAITALALPSSFAADLAQVLAAAEAVAAAAASAASSASAADADRVAAQAARVLSQADAGAASDFADQASAAAATAVGLAGVERIFNTKALADAGIGSVTANKHVIVMVDESQAGRRTLYQKVSGAYVLVVDLNAYSDLTVTGSIIVPETQSIRIGQDTMPNLGSEGTYNFPGANIAIGLEAGFSNVEGGMVAIGYRAGYSAGAVGDESAITAVGWEALRDTTTGHATGFGWGAGRFNTTGHIATFGDESSGSNTTGTTAALGYYAAFGNVTGLVTAVGYQAGRFSGPATEMTLLGHNAGLYNEGSNLTALGHRAAEANTDGVGNTVVGHQVALSNTTGSLLTALGINALFSNEAGYDHTAVGANAGRSVNGGYQSTFIGSGAGFDALQKTAPVNSIAIGYGAYTAYDHQTVIGNSSTTRTTLFGKLGVNGKADPQFAIDALVSAGTTAVNVKTGDGFGLTLRINDGSDGLGYGANYRHAFQYGGGESLAVVEGTTVRMVVEGTSGNVGIGDTAPEYVLDVAGPIGFTPGSSVTPTQNGDVVFELTSDTSLTVKAKGSDGTVRTNVLALAA